MTNTKTQADPTSDLDREIAGRIGRAWREIRRGATASQARDAIFGIGGSAGNGEVLRIASGSRKGQGAVDQMLAMLIEVLLERAWAHPVVWDDANSTSVVQAAHLGRIGQALDALGQAALNCLFISRSLLSMKPVAAAAQSE